jgi:methyl-accepting chemotaxis protein
VLANAALSNHVLKGMALAVLIGFACALCLGVWLTNTITRPVGSVIRTLGEVAAGDLTARLSVDSNDEIGQMGKALDTTLERVGSAMRSIADSSLALSSSSEQLSAVSYQNLKYDCECGRGADGDDE